MGEVGAPCASTPFHARKNPRHPAARNTRMTCAVEIDGKKSLLSRVSTARADVRNDLYQPPNCRIVHGASGDTLLVACEDERVVNV